MENNRVIRILFVCLGNICRSPMAEAIFKHLVDEEGLAGKFHIESAGTGKWHVDQPPHPGTLDVLRRNAVNSQPKFARQINGSDFQTFDYIIAMDAENVADIQARFGIQVHKLMEFAPQSLIRDVPDPYYDGNFDLAFRLIYAGCTGLLEHIRQAEHL